VGVLEANDALFEDIKASKPVYQLIVALPDEDLKAIEEWW